MNVESSRQEFTKLCLFIPAFLWFAGNSLIWVMEFFWWSILEIIVFKSNFSRCFPSKTLYPILYDFITTGLLYFRSSKYFYWCMVTFYRNLCQNSGCSLLFHSRPTSALKTTFQTVSPKVTFFPHKMDDDKFPQKLDQSTEARMFRRIA